MMVGSVTAVPCLSMKGIFSLIMGQLVSQILEVRAGEWWPDRERFSGAFSGCRKAFCPENVPKKKRRLDKHLKNNNIIGGGGVFFTDNKINRLRLLARQIPPSIPPPEPVRHGIVTPSAGLLPPNHYLSAAVSYLFEHRPNWSKDAAIGKTIVSSQMIDRIAAKLGRKLYEVPVGFKWFVDGLLNGSLAFGGEESAGASFARLDGSVNLSVKPPLERSISRVQPALMHEAMAATLDTAVEQIKKIQQEARVHGKLTRPRWPMVVLKSPKGWTGPKVVDGLQVEGTFRAHQVPLSDPAAHPEHLELLEDWLKSYRPEELFDGQGRLRPELAELAPKAQRRMGANDRLVFGEELVEIHVAQAMRVLGRRL